ncbi:MAG: hypothetical protein AAF974_06295 [Cyanobacteria bacterium P01_E01_bin.34]
MLQSKTVKILLVSAMSLGMAACGRNNVENGQAVLSQDVGVLQYVPADTPYVFATSGTIPADVLSKLEENSDSVFTSYENLLETMLDEVNEFEPDSEKQEDARRMMLLGKELAALMNSERLQEAGIPHNPQMAVYGVGMLPVYRIALEDPAAFEATIAELEETAGGELLEGEIDGQPYLYFEDEGIRIILGVFDDQFVATIAPTELSDELLDDVLGLELPNESLAQSDELMEIADHYDFTPHALGFFDVERMVATFLDEPTGVNAELLALMNYDSSALTDVCRSEIREMSAVMPRVVTGYTDLTATEISSNTVFELRSDLASGLSTLAAPVSGLGIDPGGFFSFGMSLDLVAARDFFAGQLDALEAEPYECELLAELQTSMLQGRQVLNQPLVPPFDGIKGFLAVVDSIDGLDFENEQLPTSVGARFLLANDDPASLLAMLGLFSPEVARLNLQPDGNPVQLDVAQLTGQPQPFLVDSTYVAMTDDALAVAIGDSSASRLAELFNADTGGIPPVFSAHLDSSRYYELIAQALEAEYQTAKVSTDGEALPADVEAALNRLMTGAGEMVERLSMNVIFTENGIEFPASATLPE